MTTAMQAAQTVSQVVSTNDIRDIRPPVEIGSVWAWLGWTLLVVAVAVAAVFLWRRWRKKKAVATVVPLIPPHERARRKLEAALDLYDQPKPFCILVSDSVRLYLEERFDLQAPDRTTEEFLQELKDNAQVSSVHKEVLQGFLSACDLVKFARHHAGRVELEGLYAAALRLIEETTPQPTTPVSSPSPTGGMASSR